jgi:hypothetical protein
MHQTTRPVIRLLPSDGVKSTKIYGGMAFRMAIGVHTVYFRPYERDENLQMSVNIQGREEEWCR